MEYIYKNDDEYRYKRQALFVIKSRLLKKVNLNIRKVHDYGIVLYDKIYIE